RFYSKRRYRHYRAGCGQTRVRRRSLVTNKNTTGIVAENTLVGETTEIAGIADAVSAAENSRPAQPGKTPAEGDGRTEIIPVARKHGFVGIGRMFSDELYFGQASAGRSRIPERAEILSGNAEYTGLTAFGHSAHSVRFVGRTI